MCARTKQTTASSYHPKLKENVSLSFLWTKIGVKCFSRFLLVARGQKLSKVSFSWTNQTANKRRRQKKRVTIFQDFTYLQKMQPRQKTAGNFQNLFEDIYSSDVWESRFGWLFEYLTVWWRYSVSDRQNRPRLAKPC